MNLDNKRSKNTETELGNYRISSTMAAHGAPGLM